MSNITEWLEIAGADLKEGMITLKEGRDGPKRDSILLEKIQDTRSCRGSHFRVFNGVSNKVEVCFDSAALVMVLPGS